MVVHWWPDASSAQRPRTSAHISLLPMLLNFNSLSATQINVICHGLISQKEKRIGSGYSATIVYNNMTQHFDCLAKQHTSSLLLGRDCDQSTAADSNNDNKRNSQTADAQRSRNNVSLRCSSSRLTQLLPFCHSPPTLSLPASASVPLLS